MVLLLVKDNKMFTVEITNEMRVVMHDLITISDIRITKS